MCLSKVCWTAWQTRNCGNGLGPSSIPSGTHNTRWCTASWSGFPQFWIFVRWISAKISSARFWYILRIRGSLLDSFLRMEPRFEDGRFLVHPDFNADASTPQLTMTTLSSLWQMAEWTTSRWLSLALAVASLLHHSAVRSRGPRGLHRQTLQHLCHQAIGRATAFVLHHFSPCAQDRVSGNVSFTILPLERAVGIELSASFTTSSSSGSPPSP